MRVEIREKEKRLLQRGGVRNEKVGRRRGRVGKRAERKMKRRVIEIKTPIR